MATLTLVARMLPLALGNGPGAEQRRSIAIVVIGGQSLSLILPPIVTPVACSLFDDLGSLYPGVIRKKLLRQGIEFFEPLQEAVAVIGLTEDGELKSSQ